MIELFYIVPVLLFLVYYLYRFQRHQRQSEVTQRQAIEDGLSEPASIHPLIDRNKCIGCKSCIAACPQQLGHNVLGIYHGKAELLEPANCIGHGLCEKVCPVGAISLVFGSEKRGVDIPQVNEQFETNVKGIYIAGELGGMGLIRNAIEQGKMALKFLAENLPKSSNNEYQAIIVGAGPAGIAATLKAQELGLKYLTIDQDSMGGTVFKYPRGKLVMTHPADLPIAGRMHFKETSKEELLEFWQQIASQTKIKIQSRQSLSKITPLATGFELETTTDKFTTDAVLLALGRRGTPRTLGVPGEELPKVVYNLTDPEQYAGKKVLIVGGGDSALEAATSIADVAGTEVSLSYRSDSFSRAKAKNRERIDQYGKESRIRVILSSQVLAIKPDGVLINRDEGPLELENDAVIVNAGGILPTGFLKEVGIEVETKYGTR